MKKKNPPLVVFILLVFTSQLIYAQPNRVILNTQSGKVKGILKNGITVFKSIPYAAPPVGERRFAAPVAHEPWTGIRDATRQGPTAPFTVLPEGDIEGVSTMGKGWIKGDDFLALNIWAPVKTSKQLPVMVFIHGGAFVIGTSDVPLFDGTSFAKNGVVYVSINYRMGIEGFLKIPGVPTNIGIRDQVAALHWVQNNIAEFGGDPSNVTVFGESAGAISIGVLMVSPAAKGLFKRCIMESGSGQTALSGEQADRIADQYAKTLKISNNRAGFARFTPEQLLAAQPKVTPKMVKLETETHIDPTGGVTIFLPVIDNDILPDIPLAVARKKEMPAVDLMIGYNTDEINYFLVPTGLLKKVKFNFILNKAVQMVHPAPSAVIAVYKKEYPKKNLGQLLAAILTSFQAQVPSIRLANAFADAGNNTFMYEFAWPSSVKNGVYGAYHGLELPFVFDNMQSKGERGMLGPKGGPQVLADKMHAAWINFATTGNPGWDAYTIGERKTMLFNTASEIQTNPHEKILAAWDGVRDKY